MQKCPLYSRKRERLCDGRTVEGYPQAGRGNGFGASCTGRGFFGTEGQGDNLPRCKGKGRFGVRFRFDGDWSDEGIDRNGYFPSSMRF